MPATLSLQQPIRDGGIRTINFFNGRLLSGRDMGREQQARREGLARLGQTMGQGVVSGLKVSVTLADGKPVATIGEGLAVNADGQALALGSMAQVLLTEAIHPDSDSVRCLFKDCAPVETGKQVIDSGQQLYVLTIAPAFVSEGRAPMNSSGEGFSRCNTDATVEAVQFRLIEVTRTHWPNIDLKVDPILARNRVAYRFFDKRVLPDWAGNLALADSAKPAMPQLYGAQEVPLALIAFVDNFQPAFVDNWSVRRRVHLADEANLISTLSGPARQVTGEAMFHQFHDQLADMTRSKLTSIVDQFDWIPAAGIIPNLNDAAMAALFKGMKIAGPYHIDQAAVEPIIRESLTAPAIETKSGHAIWLYRIAESQMAKAASNDMLIFASRYLPYRGDGRFDLSHFDYANYTLEF